MDANVMLRTLDGSSYQTQYGDTTKKNGAAADFSGNVGRRMFSSQIAKKMLDTLQRHA
jgi:hypothetical protein